MKRIILPILLVLSGLFFVSCAKVDVAKALEERKAAAEDGQWEQVHNNLKEVIDSNKVDKELEGADRLYAFYIQSKMHLGKMEEALVTAEDAYKKFPQNQRINYLLGKLYYEKGERLTGVERKEYIGMSVAFLETAHKMNPEDINCMTLLLNASLEADSPQTLKWYEEASTMAAFKEDSAFYNQWGKAYSSRNMHPEALNKYIKSIGLNESNAVAYLNAGITYDKHMRYPKVARKYYIKYLQVLRLNNDDNIATRKKVQGRLRELTKL